MIYFYRSEINQLCKSLVFAATKTRDENGVLGMCRFDSSKTFDIAKEAIQKFYESEIGILDD